MFLLCVVMPNGEVRRVGDEESAVHRTIIVNLQAKNILADNTEGKVINSSVFVPVVLQSFGMV